MASLKNRNWAAATKTEAQQAKSLRWERRRGRRRPANHARGRGPDAELVAAMRARLEQLSTG